MAALSRELHTTFLFATHDEKVIRYLRRKIVLDDGQREVREFCAHVGRLHRADHCFMQLRQ